MTKSAGIPRPHSWPALNPRLALIAIDETTVQKDDLTPAAHPAYSAAIDHVVTPSFTTTVNSPMTMVQRSGASSSRLAPEQKQRQEHDLDLDIWRWAARSHKPLASARLAADDRDLGDWAVTRAQA